MEEILRRFVVTFSLVSLLKVDQAIAFMCAASTNCALHTSCLLATSVEPRRRRSRENEPVQKERKIDFPTAASEHEAPKSFLLHNEPQNRNAILSRRGLGSVFVVTALGAFSADAVAAVTDETDLYANNNPDSAYSNLNGAAGIKPRSTNFPGKQSEAVPSDEITLSFTKEDFVNAPNGLGLELGEVSFRTNSRIYIKSIRPDSLAASIPTEKLKPGFVLVEINGKSTERTNAKGAQMMFAQALKDLKEGKENSIQLALRDPAVFESSLNALGKETNSVTTQVAPAGETTQRNKDGSIKLFEKQTFQDAQKITVTQLKPPTFPIDDGGGAQIDDLLEISYIGRVLETDQVFDGSTVSINGKGIPGRAGDVSLFFVLGKQPFGQFPPGWDVGLKGMGIGERRRLIIPPVLAYGSKGLPRRGIPPDSTLQYDVTLISINGLAVPPR